jgi:hypothetical protein
MEVRKGEGRNIERKKSRENCKALKNYGNIYKGKLTRFFKILRDNF